MKHFIYSIHSFECKYRLTDYQYRALTDLIRTTARGSYAVSFGQNDIWIYKYRKKGLQIHICSTCYHYQSLHIIVNPKTILNPDNICDIFDPATDDMNMVFEKINELLSFMGKSYQIENFVLKRIDICVDTYLKDDNTVREMICLAQKGVIPRGYRDNLSILINQKKNINRTFSLDIKNNQGKQITLYNKYRQLLDIGIEQEKALEAYGTLRIEIKLSSSWLKKYIHQYGFEDSMVSAKLMIAFMKNSKNIIYSHIQQIYFAGNHYKLKEAINKINHSSLKKNYKTILIPYVHYAAKHHSLKSAEEIMVHTHGISKATLQRALKALAAININPVTIGKNRRSSSLDGLHSILGIKNI